MSTVARESSPPTLNPVLREFWLTPARERVLYGGRSSSKSWDAAGFAVFLATQCRIRVLCARQFQNKIAESVYTLLKIQIDRFGLRDQFVITENSIRHKLTGSEFMFYGLWRHIDEIKSLESIDICWIEEAHNLTAEQWEILEPTLRGEGSQFWIIFNPRLASDFVYRKFITGTPSAVISGKIKGVVGATIKRLINYDENPFLSDTIVKVIERKRAEDEEEYRHIYHGEPRQDDDAVIIKRSWLMAAIDAHKKLGLEPAGRKRVGFDIADSGADFCATVIAHGFLALQCDEWKAAEDELLKSAGRVHRLARESGADIDFDSIGVGAFAGAHFAALNEEHAVQVTYRGFNAGGGVLNPEARVDPHDTDPNAPTNKDFYANVKAQAWWDIARRLRNTFNAVEKGHRYDAADLIAISSECEHLDQLIDELATPRKDVDNAGRSKVESKKDLAKRDVASPNKADAFVMAFAPIQSAPTVQMLLSSAARAKLKGNR
uniref:PBSX family phage terminase large subunit n=1 Tax=Alloyangia mangrovi TaxID=1779329 RepID=A0A2A3K0Y5_9RHOB